jgi:hypothetical protein
VEQREHDEHGHEHDHGGRVGGGDPQEARRVRHQRHERQEDQVDADHAGLERVEEVEQPVVLPPQVRDQRERQREGDELRHLIGERLGQPVQFRDGDVERQHQQRQRDGEHGVAQVDDPKLKPGCRARTAAGRRAAAVVVPWGHPLVESSLPRSASRRQGRSPGAAVEGTSKAVVRGRRCKAARPEPPAGTMT